jgi:hypothetical protein
MVYPRSVRLAGIHQFLVIFEISHRCYQTHRGNPASFRDIWRLIMSITGVSATPLRKAIRHELQAIRGKWIWLVALGIALMVLGTILLGSPVIATLATVTALGVLILVGGGMEVVGAFWCQEWSGFFLALLSGVLGVVVGLMLLGNPIQGGSR